MVMDRLDLDTSGAVTLPGRGAGFLHVGRYGNCTFNRKQRYEFLAVYLFPSRLFLSLLWACFCFRFVFFLNEASTDR